MDMWGNVLEIFETCLALRCFCFPLGEGMIQMEAPTDLGVPPQYFRSLFSNNGYETHYKTRVFNS